MFADSSSHECHAKHVFCFFMCYDTSPRMARFYWLLTFLLCSIALFFVSHAVARAWGFSHQFGVVLHLVPLFFIVLGHVPLIGLRYEDLSARDPDSSCDPVMMRVLTVTVVVMIGVAFAGSITLDKWWSSTFRAPGSLRRSKPMWPRISMASSGGAGSRSRRSIYRQHWTTAAP